MGTTRASILLLTTVITLCIGYSARGAEPEMTDTYIFEHAKATNEAGKEVTTFYRIPSLVTAKDGTLLR